jgi:Bacterial PH domain
MEGIRFRVGMSCRVEVNREGIAIRKLWQGTKLLPWELVSAVNAVQLLHSVCWSIQVVLADGDVVTLPNRFLQVEPLHSAMTDIHQIWGEVRAEQRSEPADEVPWEHRAAAVRELRYRGGIRRNGALLLALAVFGLLGVLLMNVSAHAEFGPSGLAGVPGSCTAAAAAQGTAAESWCSVTDGHVREIDHEVDGGLILWLGSERSGKQDPESDAQEVEFATTVPALSALRVGDPIDYLAQTGEGIASVTVHGVTVAADADDLGWLEGTVAGQRIAQLSGFVGAVCWPLFFGLWAACQRWPRRLRVGLWALPALAAAWLTGVIGFVVDDQVDPVILTGGLIRLGLILALIGTVCWAGTVALRTWLVPLRRRSALP